MYYIYRDEKLRKSEQVRCSKFGIRRIKYKSLIISVFFYKNRTMLDVLMYHLK